MAVCSWCKKKVGEDCKKCQCGQVQYCSSRCQTKHLNEKHKDECKGPPDSGDDNDDWNSSDDDSEYILIDTRTKNQRKNHILDNWRGMSPEQVVAEVRNMYSNTATASSQLSLIKTALKKSKNPPPDEYLRKLRLEREEYQGLQKAYVEKRDKRGANLRTIYNADDLVRGAIERMTSSDHRLLWSSCICCSGLRPVELLTADFQLSPKGRHMQAGFWICVSNWAKKGGDKKKNFCRDHPLLCPSWLFIRAINIIRAYFCKEKLTKRQYSQRYSRYWLQLMAKGFPNLVQPTHVLFRRFYAKYSYIYFKDDFQNTIGENVYITHVLGHTSSEPALTYANLHLAPNQAGKLKLFQIGKAMANLKTDKSGDDNKTNDDKRRRPREHTDLAQRRI